MKRMLPAIIVLFTVAIFIPSASFAKSKARIRIKMATLAPRGSTMMNIVDELRAEIRKKTANEVDFKVYCGGVQGDEKDVLRKIRMKQLHGGFFTGHGLGQIVPAVRVLEIPYLYWNYGETTYVREHLERTLNQYFEDEGFVVMGWNEVGFVYTFSKVPITTLEVARGLKWWVWEDDPIGRAMFKVLDISPVPLSFTDVMTSLSTKLIDTAPTTPFGAVAFRWHTRFQYMSEYPSTIAVGASIIDKDIWEKVSPQSRKTILDVTKTYYDRLIRANREENRKCIEILKKSGISIVPNNPNDPELQFILDAARKARESLVGKIYPRELLDQTLALLKEYRENHPDSTIISVH